MDQRLYLGYFQLPSLLSGPSLTYALLVPRQYVAVEAQAMAIKATGTSSGSILDALNLSLRAGPMLRLGHRDDTGRGLTGDLRLLAVANFLSLLAGGSSGVFPSVAAEAEATYWPSASYGFSLRLQTDLIFAGWFLPVIGISAGVAF